MPQEYASAVSVSPGSSLFEPQGWEAGRSPLSEQPAGPGIALDELLRQGKKFFGDEGEAGAGAGGGSTAARQAAVTQAPGGSDTGGGGGGGVAPGQAGGSMFADLSRALGAFKNITGLYDLFQGEAPSTFGRSEDAFQAQRTGERMAFPTGTEGGTGLSASDLLTGIEAEFGSTGASALRDLLSSVGGAVGDALPFAGPAITAGTGIAGLVGGGGSESEQAYRALKLIAELASGPFAPITGGLFDAIATGLFHQGGYIPHRQQALDDMKNLVPGIFENIAMAGSPDQLRTAIEGSPLFTNPEYRIKLGEGTAGDPMSAMFSGGYEAGDRMWQTVNPLLHQALASQFGLINAAQGGGADALKALHDMNAFGLSSARDREWGPGWQNRAMPTWSDEYKSWLNPNPEPMNPYTGAG